MLVTLIFLEGEKMAEEEKKTTPPTGVTIKKQSEIKKFGRSIIADDAGNIGKHLVSDTIVPGIKKLLTDAGTNFVQWLFNGIGKGGNSGKPAGAASRISYIDYNKPYSYASSTVTPLTSVYEMDEFGFDDRGEAELYLTRLKEVIVRRGVASCSDFYDLLGMRCPFTAEEWGWRDLSSASVRKGMDGKYYINFPKITSLK